MRKNHSGVRPWPGIFPGIWGAMVTLGIAVALALQSLVRQGILHLRAEPRKTRLGGLLTTALAALVLIAGAVFLAR